AALAEAIASVTVAQLGRLFVQTKSAACLRVDHFLGLAVAGGMGLGGLSAAVPLFEIALQLGKQLPANVPVGGRDGSVGLEEVDGKIGAGVGVIADSGDGHRGVLGSEEAGSDAAARPARRDGDEVGQ